MTLKIASALIAVTLAVSPVLGQSTEQIPTDPSYEDQPPVDSNSTVAPSSNISPVPMYSPAWTERWWVDAGYMMSFVRPVHVPALVTTSPAGTPQNQAGVLGNNTQVLFGDRGVDDNFRSGFRIGGGYWFDNDRTLGFNVGFFWLSAIDQTYSASSNGSTILARPYIDSATGAPASLLVAFPLGSGPAGSTAPGSINISASSGQFYGAHFDFQESILNDPNFRLKSLLGYRYIHYSDSLQISSVTEPTGGSPAPPPGTQLFVQDNFSAINNFNGGEVGFEMEWIRGPFAVSVLAKAAAGVMSREININGNTLITAPGNPTSSSPGGLLALPTNSGTYSSNVFTFVPEVGLNLSWDVTANLRLTAGYSLMVLFDTVRAAEQIDTTINSSLLNPNLTPPATPSAAGRPAFSLQQSNMWVQTVNVGLEIRY
jgi:Putative beta barrel porin-7 (BBP7)